MAEPVAVVLADDLIWGTRLRDQLRAAGADAILVRQPEAFEARLRGATVAVVDLTARAYDGVTEIGRATRAGVRVLAVGQHDDLEHRKRALAAGAERVFAYRKLFEDGEATLRAWLGALPAGSATE